jgi:hypothetical protein
MSESRAQMAQIHKMRWLVVRGLARAVAITVLLVVAYYLLPLDSLSSAPWLITFIAALTILAGTGVWQVRAVMVSPNPAIRAIEGIAGTAPLFVLLFAATYFVMARADPARFSIPDLSRTTTETSRIVVTVQMVLDLIVLGLGVRAFVGAVRLGRERAGQRGDPFDPTA